MSTSYFPPSLTISITLQTLSVVANAPESSHASFLPESTRLGAAEPAGIMGLDPHSSLVTLLLPPSPNRLLSRQAAQ